MLRRQLQLQQNAAFASIMDRYQNTYEDTAMQDVLTSVRAERQVNDVRQLR